MRGAGLPNPHKNRVRLPTLRQSYNLDSRASRPFLERGRVSVTASGRRDCCDPDAHAALPVPADHDPKPSLPFEWPLGQVAESVAAAVAPASGTRPRASSVAS